MAEHADKSGCFGGPAPGCAAVITGVLLLTVLLIEHTLHLFQGLLALTAGLAGAALVVAGSFWILKRRMARAANEAKEQEP